MKSIVIVGAGPVGLCTALGLAKKGIPSTIIEAKKGFTCTGSRAIVLDKGTLIYFREIDCIDSVLQKGLVAERRRTFYRGLELYRNEFPGKDAQGLPFFVNLPQTDTEEILLRRAQASSLITLRWGHTLTAVNQTEDEVTLTVDHQGSTSELPCDCVVACDGCRSSVRKLSGLGLPGTTNPYRFLIVDVKTNLPFEREHHFHFDAPQNPGHTLLLVPQPKGIWRIDWQLPRGDTTNYTSSPDLLAQRVRDVVNHDDFTVVWSSQYSFHQRLMPQMAHGRILFAGDAAHLVNPFGARGMNSGIQDARVACEKISHAMCGCDPTPHFMEYSSERWKANHEHQSITTRTMNFIAPRSLPRRMLRNMVLQGSRHIPRLRKFVDSGKMSTVCSLTHSRELCSQQSPSTLLKILP